MPMIYHATTPTPQPPTPQHPLKKPSMLMMAGKSIHSQHFEAPQAAHILCCIRPFPPSIQILQAALGELKLCEAGRQVGHRYHAIQRVVRQVQHLQVGG